MESASIECVFKSSSIRGKRHIEKNMLCQDRLSYGSHGSLYVAVLADGIGKTDVNAYCVQEVVEVIRDTILDNFYILYDMSIDGIRELIIKKVYQVINVYMDRYSVNKSELASTIMAVAYDASTGNMISLHLGDGTIFIKELDSVRVFSFPETGVIVT